MQLNLAILLPFLLAAPPDQGLLLVRVVDPAGQPLPGATVSLIAAGDCPQIPELSTLTDNLGEAHLRVPKNRRYEIRFALAGLLGGTVGPLTLSPVEPFQITARMYGVRDEDRHRIVGEPQLIEITKTPR